MPGLYIDMSTSIALRCQYKINAVGMHNSMFTNRGLASPETINNQLWSMIDAWLPPMTSI